MNEHANRERRPFRFSLRLLFVAVAAAAVGFWLGLMLAERMRSADGGFSPDQDDFWLSWFYRGDENQRKQAVDIISYRARGENPDRRFVKVLGEAAADEDPAIRFKAAVGLEHAAKSDTHARLILQGLADQDPDENVRRMARQALTEGIP